MKVEDENGVRYEGYCVDLIEAIADDLKFQYKIKEVDDGSYGRKDDLGEWNGMIRELIDGARLNGRSRLILKETAPWTLCICLRALLALPFSVKHSKAPFTFVLVDSTKRISSTLRSLLEATCVLKMEKAFSFHSYFSQLCIRLSKKFSPH
ncbi:hypothetical protein TNCV_4243561 [Trichonephila clavipes]|nr:hypothetical protein TNCV_4243561 [Trichonephila clavipes]